MQWNMDHSRHNIEDVAAGYEALPKYDPKAEHAWQQLAAESKKHADYIRQHLNVTETDNPEPYDTSEDMIRDIRNNRNFVVSTANSEHPIWTPEQNVDFRIVHDVFGHAATEGDFGWHGENDACSTHFALSSPHAQKALATECLGQTGYAIHRGGFTDQKVGFIPGLHEGLAAANEDTPIPTQAQLMQRALYGPPKQSKWVISEKPKYDPKELEMGIQVEKEHKDTVGDNPKIWEQIAKDHLDEMPDYYTRLKKMEESGKKKSNWKVAANPATEQRIQRIADEAKSKGLEVQQYDNDGYLETQIHIGQDEYYDSRYVIYISHGKNRTQSVFYDRPESKDYKTNLSAIEQEINSIEPENFDEMEFGRQTEMFNDKKILWNRYSKWKISESQDANRMYRQHTDGTPVAETTFESIQNKDTSEPYEDEYIIVDGKKWKKVRRKNNPQPDNYKDPIGGWGFYSKLLDKMEEQPWTVVSVEKAKPIDVNNLSQYKIPSRYKIVEQMVPHFARYGVIPIAARGSHSAEGFPLTSLPQDGNFVPGATRDNDTYIEDSYHHNINLYDPEIQQIVYGMQYSLNHPDAFEYHSTDQFGNSLGNEEELYESKYPTYVDSIHYNAPARHNGADDPHFYGGSRIYLSDLDEMGKPTNLFGNYKEVVDNFNKRYPRLSLSVLRWMQQNLPKPIGADIINPKLKEKAKKQDFVTLSKWKKISVPPAEKAEEYAKGYEKSEEPDPEYLQERYKWNPEVRGHRWKLNYNNLERAFNHPNFPVKGKYNVFTVDPKSAPTDDTTMKHWKRTPLGTHEAAAPNKAGSIHINPLISAESANEALWHELQHAYQDQEGRFTPEMREKYFDPTDIAGLSDEEVERRFKENYLEHPMEIDANKFADFMREYPLIEESEPIYKSRWVNFSMANKDVNEEIKSIIDRYYEEHGSKRRLPLPSIESKWKKRSTYLPGFYSTTLLPDEENGGYKMIVATDERMSHWDIHPANGTYPEYRGLYSPEFKQILHLSSPEEYDIRRDILPSKEHLKATPEEHEKTWMDAASKGAHFVAPSGDKGNYGDLPNNVRGLLKDETKLNIVDKKPIKVESVHAMHKREGIPNEEFKFRFNTPEENSEKYWHQVTFASPSPKESKWKIAGKTKTRLLQDAKDLDENYTDTSEIVHKFDDGWTIRKLNTIGDAHREGTLMSNCMTPEGDWPPPYCDVAARIDPDFSIEKHKDFPWEDYYDEKIRKDDEAIYSLRDPENLPHATYDSGDGSGFDSPILGRHNDLPKPEYRKYWDEWFKANKKQPFYWNQWDKQSKWIKKEAPARSKAQFRYMQGICNGSIKPPKGMTRAQACEYVEGQKDYKDLPEKKSKLDMQQDLEKILMKQGFSEKGAILMALDYMSKLSYWIDGYHAAVALRDPESGDWYMDIGFSDKLTHGGVTADYINDLGTKAMRESVSDKDSRTHYYNHHTARGLYNPVTKDFIHMSHPDFWDETDYNFKSLDQDERDRMEAFWRQLAEQTGIELESIRVLNNQTGHLEDMNIADLEMPEEVERARRMYERNRPLNPWERERGGYDTKTGKTKTSHWIKGYNAAIINQDGKMEIAESDPDRIYYDDDDDDDPTEEWHLTHWDIGGMPRYRGLYNPKTRDLIHMTSPEEYHRITDGEGEWYDFAENNRPEYPFEEEAINPEGHKDVWANAAREAGIPVDSVRLMYADRNQTRKNYNNQNDETDFNIKTAHWIQGFQAAIINQNGEMETALPNAPILDDKGNIIDEDDTPWYSTHWDLKGYPQYRGLYNHDTGELIHMTSPEEHEKITGTNWEYLDKDEAVNPLEHETFWRDAAQKSNIPINDFKLLYAKHTDEEEIPYRHWSNPLNTKDDFDLTDPEEFIPKQSKWKKKAHWLEGYHAAVITPKGEMKIAKDWHQFHGSLLPDAATLARRGFHRGLYNPETGQLLHMTTPEEWKKLEDSWGSYEEEDPDVRWPLGFEWIRDPKDFVSPYKTEKEWLKAAESSEIPVSEVKFFSGEPEVNPFTAFDVNDFNLHSPQEIAAKYGKWKKQSHWIEGFHSAIINQNGEMEVAPPGENNWLDTHWDIGGYPKYRGLYNHDTGQLIHMTSPEEHDRSLKGKLDDRPEYLYEEESLYPEVLLHQKAWELAAKKSNIPVNKFSLLYAQSGERSGQLVKKWWKNKNQLKDFRIENPHSSKISRWKTSKKDAWEAVLDGELGHDIITTGTWEEVKKQTIKWLKQLKDGYINKKNPHDNKKIDPEAKEQDGHALEDLKLYEEKKRWSFHFDHGKHPYDLIIQPVGYKESANNWRHGDCDLFAIKAHKDTGWPIYKIAEKPNAGAWHFFVMNPETGMALDGDGYRKSEEILKEHDPDFNSKYEELGAYPEIYKSSLEEAQNYRQGYKESKWKISMAERTGDPEIDSLIEEFLKGGGYWFDFEDKGTDFKYKDQAGKEYNWENVTPEIYQQNVDELPLETGEAQIRRWQDPEQAHGSCGDASMSFINFLNRKGFKAECVDIDGWYMDKGEKPFYPEITRPEATGHAVVKITKDGKTYIIDWTAAQFQYARENWREGPIEDFKQFPFIHKQDEAGNWQRSWDKESKWRKRSHWVEGFHAAGITPEGEMLVGPKWTTYHGELSPESGKEAFGWFNSETNWRGLYNPETNEVLHMSTPEEYGRFGYTETAANVDDFKHPHDFYRDAWQNAANKSGYPIESIHLFSDPEGKANPALPNDKEDFSLTRIGAWKIADKKKKNIHPKFQTSLKEHQRSVRKYGPLKTHKVRNFKKKSVLNEEQAKELFEYEPYMYHDVAAARGKTDIRDQIETVRSIMNNGILPKEETGVSEYDDWLTSRPHHVYIGRRGFYQRTMPPAIRINMSKIDPSTLKPDEDIYHAFGFSDKHKDEIDMHELKSAPFEEEHRNNPDYTLGKWMDDNAHLDTPKNVLASYGLNNSLAVLGGVPSDALEINPEWVEKIKERHGIDITKML